CRLTAPTVGAPAAKWVNGRPSIPHGAIISGRRLRRGTDFQKSLLPLKPAQKGLCQFYKQLCNLCARPSGKMNTKPQRVRGWTSSKRSKAILRFPEPLPDRKENNEEWI